MLKNKLNYKVTKVLSDIICVNFSGDVVYSISVQASNKKKVITRKLFFDNEEDVKKVKEGYIIEI